MSILDLGWLGDLVAQHLYDENDTPYPQRRGWRIIIDATVAAATVVDNVEKGTLDITLPAGEVEAIANTLIERDSAGRARVVGVLGSEDAPLTLASQGGENVAITSEGDVDVSVAAVTNVLRLLVGETERMTITPASGSLVKVDLPSDGIQFDVTQSFVGNSGRDVIFDYADGRSFIVNEDGVSVFRASSSNGTELRSNVSAEASLSLAGDAATLAADSDVSVTAGAVVDIAVSELLLRLTNDGADTLQVQPFAPIDLRPAQVDAGVGHKTTIGGGPGASGSLAGPLDVDLGAVVSSASARMRFLANSVEIGSIRQTPAFSSLALEATTTLYLASGNQSILWGPSFVRQESNGFVSTRAPSVRVESTGGVLIQDSRNIVTALAASGTQTIATVSFTSMRVWRVCVIVTWSNNTDKTGGSCVLVGTFTSYAGAETQVGASHIDSDHFRSSDTGIASAAAFDLSYSVNTVRVRVNPGDADSRSFNVEFVQNERVIT